jgi:hypothetical protein
MVITVEAAAVVTVNPPPHHQQRTSLRHALLALSLLTGPLMLATPAAAQVSIDISIPGISVGINQPDYPELVLVPGSPVYYAPRAQTNYFFYDGLFWVYQDDRWYASPWYDGPWDLVDPYDVPIFVLRVPVHYYVRPPVYFYGWVVSAPPRWDMHWGPRWARHRHGWDHWDYRAIPRPAPPPVYQRHYFGERYPRPEHQHGLREQNYRYQPHDVAVRRHFQERPASRVPAPVQIMPPTRMEAPHAQYSQRDGNRDGDRRSAPVQAVPQQREPFVQQQQSQRQELQRPEVPRQEHQRQEPERRLQTAAPVASVVVQPQAVQRPREDVQRHAPIQVAPLMAPPPDRNHPVQEQRHVMRQDTPQAQRDPGPLPMRQSAQQGRGNDQPRGHPERGQGPERGR